MRIDTTYQCGECGHIGIPAVEGEGEGATFTCTNCGSCDGDFEEIPTDLSVEMITYRLRRMTGVFEGIEAQHKLVIKALADQRDRAARRLEQFMAWAKPLLEAWYKAHPPRKGKTIDIAGTKIGYRAVAAGFELEEGADTKGTRADLANLHAALRWALEHKPELVKEELALKWGDLKALLKEMPDDANLPPGVKRTAGKEEFFVR